MPHVPETQSASEVQASPESQSAPAPLRMPMTTSSFVRPRLFTICSLPLSTLALGFVPRVAHAANVTYDGAPAVPSVTHRNHRARSAPLFRPGPSVYRIEAARPPPPARLRLVDAARPSMSSAVVEVLISSSMSTSSDENSKEPSLQVRM
jgi:hypothetical protein